MKTISPDKQQTLRAMAEHIQIWPIETLTTSAENPRTHSEQQIAQIRASLREFGFMVPIVADSERRVISGHGRLLAARQLNLDRVPVILADHLSESEKRAFAIADNKIASNAGWDEELLKVRLDALSREGFNLNELGFTDKELDKLLRGLQSSGVRTDEDAVGTVPVLPVTIPGDCWHMASHRLLCGDARHHQSYSDLLGSETADMVFADPPYNVAYKGSRSEPHRAIANDDLGAGFGEFLRETCGHMVRATRGAVYICMSSSELHTLYEAFTAAGGHWSTYVVWGKSTFTLGRADYQRQFEPILYGWPEGKAHYWCGARDQGDLWLIDKPYVNDLHPTMKPVALIERAVVNSSRRGDVVLDPFGGSGSTLIACEKTARKARLIELEPAYCDVIVKRWQDATGRQAVHATSDQTFEQVALERLVCDGASALAERAANAEQLVAEELHG